MREQIELSTWKEIAQYLGVSVRTAQLWDRDRSLPVKRLPSGRVFADRAELDAWRLSAQPSPPLAAEPPAPSPRRWIWPAVAAAALIAVASAGWTMRAAPSPIAFRATPTHFVAIGAGGQELWSVPFPIRIDPSTLTTEAHSMHTRVLLRDLTGDGLAEVLIAPANKDPDWNDSLLVYGPTGRLLWTFEAGRETEAGDVRYGRQFDISRIGVARTPTGLRVVVSSQHFPNWANQIAVLDANGKLLREYWHPGHLNSPLVTADLDGDGADEIAIGGLNNSEDAATIVVLDPERLAGAPAAKPKFALTSFGPPVEKARVLFPRTCVNQLTHAYNVVDNLWLGNDGRLNSFVFEAPLTRQATLRYVLNKRLGLEAVSATDEFRGYHAALEARGVLHHKFDPRELDGLRLVAPVPPGW